jgi:hypothetical protein
MDASISPRANGRGVRSRESTSRLIDRIGEIRGRSSGKVESPASGEAFAEALQCLAGSAALALSAALCDSKASMFWLSAVWFHPAQDSSFTNHFADSFSYPGVNLEAEE